MKVLNGYVFWGAILKLWCWNHACLVHILSGKIYFPILRNRTSHVSNTKGLKSTTLPTCTNVHLCLSNVALLLMRNLMITWSWLSPMSNYSAFDIKKTQKFDLNKTYLFCIFRYFNINFKNSSGLYMLKSQYGVRPAFYINLLRIISIWDVFWCLEQYRFTQFVNISLTFRKTPFFILEKLRNTIGIHLYHNINRAIQQYSQRHSCRSRGYTQCYMDRCLYSVQNIGVYSQDHTIQWHTLWKKKRQCFILME